MATLTITLAGSAVINGTKSYTVTDADVQTLISCMQAKFGSATQGQALLDWITNTLVVPTVQEVKNFNVQQQANAINVTPISFT